MKHWVYVALVVVGLFLTSCDTTSLPVPEGKLEVQDFGTSGSDFGRGVAALPTGVGAVVVGSTDGSLNGVNKGTNDAFIRNYDGGVVWAKQFGTELMIKLPMWPFTAVG